MRRDAVAGGSGIVWCSRRGRRLTRSAPANSARRAGPWKSARRRAGARIRCPTCGSSSVRWSHARGAVGVCGFVPADRDQPLAPALDHALNLVLDQTSIALDRALLVKDSLENGGHRRKREASIDAARFALARPAHPVGGHHRLGDDAAQVWRLAHPGGPARPSRFHRRGGEQADPFRREPPGYVADRGWRAEAEVGNRRRRRRDARQPSSARARRFSTHATRPALRANCLSPRGIKG